MRRMRIRRMADSRKKLVVNHDDHINGYVIETTSSDTILNQKLKNGEYLPSLDQFLDVAKRHYDRLGIGNKTP